MRGRLEHPGGRTSRHTRSNGHGDCVACGGALVISAKRGKSSTVFRRTCGGQAAVDRKSKVSRRLAGRTSENECSPPACLSGRCGGGCRPRPTAVGSSVRVDASSSFTHRARRCGHDVRRYRLMRRLTRGRGHVGRTDRRSRAACSRGRRGTAPVGTLPTGPHTPIAGHTAASNNGGRPGLTFSRPAVDPVKAARQRTRWPSRGRHSWRAVAEAVARRDRRGTRRDRSLACAHDQPHR